LPAVVYLLMAGSEIGLTSVYDGRVLDRGNVSLEVAKNRGGPAVLRGLEVIGGLRGLPRRRVG